MGSQPEEQNTNVNTNEDNEVPADGGRRAWAVLVASFICNGLAFGVINSYGVIYRELDTWLQEEGASNPESRAVLPGALAAGMAYLTSALAGVVAALLGLRGTAVLGGCIIVLSLSLSSFVVHYINALYVTHGILYGLGTALAYTPAIAILSHYFKKYLGIVNGIVTVSESFFTAILPFLTAYMIENHGLEWMFRVLAIITGCVALGGLVYKPLPSMVYRAAPGQGCKSIITTSLNFGIWKNRKYSMWVASLAFGLCGHFITFVHLSKLIEVTFPDVNGYYINLPLQCYAATSIVGRLLFGFLSDLPRVDAIQLQQIAFYGVGVLTISIPFVGSYALVIAISLGMGIFEGGFIAVTGPVSTEICGVKDAPHGLGFMLSVGAIPVALGPPIAGHLYSVSNSYVLPFLFAGISMVICASMMFFIIFPYFGCSGQNQTEDPVAG